jgi:BASS family bile acid:Na+ symporter
MKNYSFTIIILVSVVVAYFFPSYFVYIGNVKLSTMIPYLLQTLMFGMGTTMKAEDFINVIKNPKGVFVGLICHFGFMASLAFTLTKIFTFPAEIAAGLILIGSCPSGLSSNIMAFLAKANVALSITITSLATLLSPVLTPFLMKSLGGGYIDVDFFAMMIYILKIIVLPISVGYLINTYFKSLALSLRPVLPIISMVSVLFIMIIVIAAGHDSLTQVGPLLILALVIQLSAGFYFGYTVAKKVFHLPERDSRTISFVVGLINGGLASALADSMHKLATVGLASAIFGAMMNTGGTILASFWAKKEIID